MSVYQDLTVVRDAITILHNEWAQFRNDGLFVEARDVQRFMFLLTCLVKRLDRVATHIETRPIKVIQAHDNVVVFPHGAA